MPITMKQAPAPSDLLKVVRCGCKTGCKTSKCTCHTHGLSALRHAVGVVEFLVLIVRKLILN